MSEKFFDSVSIDLRFVFGGVVSSEDFFVSFFCWEFVICEYDTEKR